MKGFSHAVLIRGFAVSGERSIGSLFLFLFTFNFFLGYLTVNI